MNRGTRSFANLWVWVIVAALLALALAGALVAQVIPPRPAQEVRITAPQDGATLDVSQPIIVRGAGRALFEGNVVVQAQDGQGRVLAEQPTILDAPEVGGAGSWEAQLQVNVAPGTPGLIVAFSTSPEDDSIVASDRVRVTFGRP